MIVAVHQPNYLPYLGYFHKMAHCDVFVLLDDVQFARRSYTQRVKIKTPNGDRWLTIPVLTKDKRDQRINEVEIDNTQAWGKKHWKSLLHSYRQASYFSMHSDFFEGIYAREYHQLGGLNECLIRYLADELKISTSIVRASSLNVKGKRTERIINICKALGGDIYLSGISGRNYLTEEKFTEAGIQLQYQDFQHPIYPQLHDEFLPYMSVVDLLFNCGDESRYILLGQGQLTTVGADQVLFRVET